MRNRGMILAAALTLASAHAVLAQTPPPTQPAAAPTASEPSLGSIDFGFRGGSVSGDEARFERYRDLRNGAFTRIVFGKETDRYVLDLGASNIGYRDQRYNVGYDNGKAKFSFLWDSIPLNYSYMSVTPWVEQSPGVFTLDSAARLAVQNRQASGVTCAFFTTCTNLTTAAAALAVPSIYRGLARPFDLQAKRDVANVGLVYQATEDLGLNVSFTTTKRGGYQPYGMSFAFNNANELPLPIDNRTNDFSVGLEWANQKGMIRVGWDSSWFNNALSSVTWDNPLRATDFSNGLVPPLGPYDPSGYSNGNGPATGRISVWPDNSMYAISTTAMYKLPNRTTVNGTFSVTTNKQNDTLIPWTTNALINTPAVFALFPDLRSLERGTAEAEVRGYNALLNFNTKPSKKLALNARYRLNKHDNMTPHFFAEEYVRFDAVPEETGGETEQFDVTRNTFDVNAIYNLMAYTTLRVGYGFDGFDRTGRSFSNMKDNTLRASLDTVGNQFVTLRAMYEFTKRKGSGFSESAIEEGGAQPGLRFYDEADRDRNRGTFLVTLSPASIVDLTASVAFGREKYKGPGHEFGLLNADTTAFTFGVNVNPSQAVSFGASYGRDLYSSLQESRNANPPADPAAGVAASDYGSWFDPNRTWSMDADETVNNVNVYLDLVKAVKNTDIRFGYDYSDSDNAYVHGGPRITELSTARALSGPAAIVYPGFAIPAPCAAGLTSCFQALPNVTNSWHRATADVKYFFTQKIGLGLGYWYEKFDVVDFATINLPGTDTPRIDYLGALTTGYGNRPYKASTGFLRLIYLF